ncbi:DUF4124 domain-containing protein [Ramlibacter sp. AW1]|uniref:DUF4124 domain-containing protein n=1 Tax=Ramlibacter aurantiacus TaxID=2801330 RepID=A0A936ZP05_9BURK|nr:DUF4124 domain-containing protein [Ramlibacter aurantiacus]
MRFTPHAIAATVGLLLSTAASAQAIYTCVDGAGRRITSDRPILECIDREQRVLNPSGTLRARIPPSYTAAERAALEKAAREEAEERGRIVEQRQRQRALLTRYPNQEVLDRERAAALAIVDDVIATATQRSASLVAERRKLESDAATHARDPERMPGTLKQAIEVNDRQLASQERYIAEQREERQRVQERFDDMQRQLNLLWAQQNAGRND